MDCQAPLSMEFPRQEYWSGLPWPPPGDLPESGIEPLSLVSPALVGRVFTTVRMQSLKGAVSCKLYKNIQCTTQNKHIIYDDFQSILGLFWGEGEPEKILTYTKYPNLPTLPAVKANCRGVVGRTLAEHLQTFVKGQINKTWNGFLCGQEYIILREMIQVVF